MSFGQVLFGTGSGTSLQEGNFAAQQAELKAHPAPRYVAPLDALMHPQPFVEVEEVEEELLHTDGTEDVRKNVEDKSAVYATVNQLVIDRRWLEECAGQIPAGWETVRPIRTEITHCED